MIWVTWRQFRTTILAAVGAILALAVVAVVGGVGLRRSANPVPFGTAFGCAKTGDGAGACWSESTLTLVTLITVGLPVLLGVLVGVTAFSRDIERGTHVLGLSQSVSRARWYWSRVLVVFVPVSVAMAILGFVLEWTRSLAVRADSAYVSTRLYGYSKLTFPLFQSSGLVAAAYTFLALILGGLVALSIRNMLGAMALTLIAMTALTVGFQIEARPHYATPKVETQPLDAQGRVSYTSDLVDLSSTWVLRAGFVDADRRAVDFDYSTCDDVLADFDWDQRPDETFADYRAREDAAYAAQNRLYEQCQRAQGIDHHETRYHPDSLFRRFQLIESALALALSALLIIPSLWAVRRLRP